VKFVPPNAAPQPRLEAGARDERTLEAVGCRRLLGSSGVDDGCIAVLTTPCFQFSKPLAKRTLFLPPTRLIPDDRRYDSGLGIWCVQERDSKGDGQGASILMDRWNTKHFGTVSGVARLHDLAISFPVPMAEALRHNEVERLAEGLALGVAEHALGCRVL